jgi:hypothetical protein
MPSDLLHFHIKYLPPALPAVLAALYSHPTDRREDDQRIIGCRPDRANDPPPQLVTNPQPASDRAGVAEQYDSVVGTGEQQACLGHGILRFTRTQYPVGTG